MAKEITVHCSCGMDNVLVESPEGLRYKLEKHGRDNLAGGKCFNCFAVLKGMELVAEEVAIKVVTDENAKKTAVKKK